MRTQQELNSEWVTDGLPMPHVPPRGILRRSFHAEDCHRHKQRRAMTDNRSTAVLEVSRVYWASSKIIAEAVLSRRPGVIEVDANPVGQTATVTYDPSQTSVAELAGWVRDCGYHCAGQSVPEHICDPLPSLHLPLITLIIMRGVTMPIMITCRATTR